MGFFRGPNSVRDGLVVQFDPLNVKSFRGEATLNVVANSLPSGTIWTVSNSGGSTATGSLLTENNNTFMRYENVIGVSGYPRLIDSIFPNSEIITGTFSTSFEARGTAGAELWLRIYESGSTKITNIATLTNDWVRYEFENQTTIFNLNQPYFYLPTTGAIYDIRNIQIENKTYSTPFVNGTRGNSPETGGGLLDISIEGIQANATFYNDITFSGEGIVLDESLFRYFIIPQPSISLSPNYWTVELTIKPTSWSGYLVSPQSAGFDHFLFFNSDESVSFQTTQSTDTNNRSMTSPSNGVPYNQWTHIIFSLDNMFKKLYINGDLVGTQDLTVDTSFAANWTGNWYFGDCAQIGGNAWSGEMSCIRVYNRVLTDEEVMQNFNSIRGRFPNLINKN